MNTNEKIQDLKNLIEKVLEQSEQTLLDAKELNRTLDEAIKNLKEEN